MRKLMKRLSQLASVFAPKSAAVETARRQVAKKQTRYAYEQGPMYYIGQRLIKAMQECGWDAMIHCCYRSADVQDQAYARGASQVQGYYSAHQYYLAVDIVHRDLFWNAPPRFWDDLNACVKVVEQELGVELNHGHEWDWVDSAHIELLHYREYRKRYFGKQMTPKILAQMFQEVLPKVWASYSQSKGFSAPHDWEEHLPDA